MLPVDNRAKHRREGIYTNLSQPDVFYEDTNEKLDIRSDGNLTRRRPKPRRRTHCTLETKANGQENVQNYNRQRENDSKQ